jgi:fructokinase
VIVVCGEALIDVVPAREVPGENGRPGDTVGARLYEARPGGSPFNAAVALARLGTPVALLARFSAADGFGRQLRTHARASGVRLDLAVDAPEPTTLALVDVADDGTASYTFHADGTADWGWLPAELPAELPADVVAVQAGSIALARPPGGDVLEAFLAREAGRVTVSIDPNVRPALIGPREDVAQRVERWVRSAGIVKISSEDLEWVHPGEGRDVVVGRWLTAGPRLLVVTDGAAGATAWVPGEDPVHQPAQAVTVADTVGAGDTTGAALLDWLARHDRLAPAGLAALTAAEAGEALRAALTAAAVTVSRPGADPPWRHELEV